MVLELLDEVSQMLRFIDRKGDKKYVNLFLVKNTIRDPYTSQEPKYLLSSFQVPRRGRQEPDDPDSQFRKELDLFQYFLTKLSRSHNQSEPLVKSSSTVASSAFFWQRSGKP